MRISQQEYAMRRKKITEKLPVGSVAVLCAKAETFRNADVQYPFRQASYFYYLTGFVEPQSVLVLVKDQNGNCESIFFCRARDPQAEVWNGKRIGPEMAKEQLQVDRTYSIDLLDHTMVKLLRDKTQIFRSMEDGAHWENQVLNWLNKAEMSVEAQEDLLPLIAEERLIKSATEIELMREAAKVSAQAHIQLMKACKPQIPEYELEALFSYESCRMGARTLAYQSIVGGGENACTLHYVENNDSLKSGDLVLVDAGGEYDYYASDITRTYPVNGKFSEDQKTLYNLVLKAQLAVIDKIKPGTLWSELQQAAVEVLVEGLVELNILKGEIKALIEEKAYKHLYMHSSGHWLGLDVHDVGAYQINNKPRKLEEGMVLTVEPGLYISNKNIEVDPRWHGIGIRIEDDVLVTAKGCEILSQSVPKEVDRIEQLMENTKTYGI